jgi:hypothetical protein
MIAPPSKAYMGLTQRSKATVIFWISVGKSNTGNINVTDNGVTHGKLKRT